MSSIILSMAIHDMLHFVLWGYDFPVFNVADSAIFLGICALFIMSWLEDPASRPAVKALSKAKAD